MVKKKSPQIHDAATFEELCSVENLGIVWSKVKSVLRNTNSRDAIDWLDWQSTIETTLPLIRDEVVVGSYEPQFPARFRIPKAKGSFRAMAVPNLRDVLVYRLVSEIALARGHASKVPGAFFARAEEKHPIGKTLTFEDWDYPGFFEVWLRYQEYRSQTLLSDPTSHLVVTDITNFFDSISHDVLMEYLAPLGLPRQLLGTLGKILDVLKPATLHSRNPGIGIPTDEFDCSRTLAHLFLFEHDRRVVNQVGSDNYVRWMDDQNVGVNSETAGRAVVHRLTESLASQRLTLNAGKTLIFSRDEAFLHFQIEANLALSAWEERNWTGKKPWEPPVDTVIAREEFEELWLLLEDSPSAGKGNWDKILKRGYRYAGRVGSGIMEGRAAHDLLNLPTLAMSIFRSYAHRNAGKALLDLMIDYVQAGESLHESVESAFFEASCALNPEAELADSLRHFTVRYLKGEIDNTTRRDPALSSAILSAYWFQTDAPTLAGLVQRGDAPRLSPTFCRSWLAIMTALDPTSWAAHQRKLLGSPSSDVLHLADFITDLSTGAGPKIPSFLNDRWNPSRATSWFEPRTWLQADLLSIGPKTQVSYYIRNRIPALRGKALTWMEKLILARINARINS